MFGNLLDRVVHRIRKTYHRPAIAVAPSPEICSLGHTYGEWHFLDRGDLRGATVIFAGLGEDASFDVEFAAAYGARVVVVDPTPRAIAHFEQIQARLGQGATERYVSGGKQPAGAYDLSGLDRDSLVLIPCALWTSPDPIRFFAPKNPAHVSYSINDIQHNHASDGDYIEVPSTTVVQIMADFDLSRIPLIKLDIEGAETEVLSQMMSAGIFPDQILVEYDEINQPSHANKLKCEACDRMLRRHGYVCVYRKGDTDFTYVRQVAVA